MCIPYTSSGKIDEISVFFSPKVIKAKKYLEKYIEMRDYLSGMGLGEISTPF